MKKIALLILLVSTSANAVPWTCTAEILEFDSIAIAKEKLTAEDIEFYGKGSDYGILSLENAIHGAFNDIHKASLPLRCSVFHLENAMLDASWKIEEGNTITICSYACSDENYGIHYLEDYLNRNLVQTLHDLIPEINLPEFNRY